MRACSCEDSFYKSEATPHIAYDKCAREVSGMFKSEECILLRKRGASTSTIPSRPPLGSSRPRVLACGRRRTPAEVRVPK